MSRVNNQEKIRREEEAIEKEVIDKYNKARSEIEPTMEIINMTYRENPKTRTTYLIIVDTVNSLMKDVTDKIVSEIPIKHRHKYKLIMNMKPLGEI